MNNRAFTISFAIAVLAVLMVYSYVTSTEETYKTKYGTEVSVVVAKKDIKELDLLDDTNLTSKPIPREFVQPGAGKSMEEFKGGLAIAPIMSGEQITRTKVTQLGARTGLARQVAIGKRAVTIRVNDESSVAKLIKPGDRVDIIVPVDLSSGNKALIEVKTLLQDVLVLATGKYVTNTVPGILESDPFKQEMKNKVRLSEYTNYANVTLEVDPYQAQSLVFASTQFNGVYLTLRNNDDNMKEELQTTMAVDILGPSSAKSRRDQAALEEQRRQNQKQQQEAFKPAPTSSQNPNQPGKR